MMILMILQLLKLSRMIISYETSIINHHYPTSWKNQTNQLQQMVCLLVTGSQNCGLRRGCL